MARRRLAVIGAVALLLPACFRGIRPESPPSSEPPPGGRILGEGLASYYGPGLDGRPTASGERFDRNALTAAHRTFRFGTCLRVVNLENGRQVQVRVNDRGPFAARRILDVSEAAARRLGMIAAGVARVRLLPCPWRTPPAPGESVEGQLREMIPEGGKLEGELPFRQ